GFSTIPVPSGHPAAASAGEQIFDTAGGLAFCSDACGGVRLIGPGLRPGGNDTVHAGVGNELPHVFVVVNDDAEVDAVHGCVFVHDFNLTLKVAGLELSASCLDCIQ